MNTEEINFTKHSSIKAIGSIVASIPGVGIILSPLLSLYNDVLSDREFSRIKELIENVFNELAAHKDEMNEEYLKNEDFGAIFEIALKKVSEERNELKRLTYKNILVNAIIKSDKGFEDIDMYMRILDRLTPDHIEILRLIYRPDLHLKNGQPINEHEKSHTTEALFKKYLQWTQVDKIRDCLYELEYMRLIEALAGGMRNMAQTSVSALQNARTTRGKALIEHIMR